VGHAEARKEKKLLAELLKEEEGKGS
jgi:hypothetical protein